MRERLALLMEYLKNRLAFGKNKKTRKGFILTMVALVEVLAISVVSVSAWVETISTITIKAEGAKIDNYVYTNADIGSGDGYSNKTIDLTKYFRAAGGVHLASASSANGENIFFPIKKSGASEFDAKSYRCADVNDKNVNYIDFSFNVKVDETFKANHAEFYLDHVPKITIDGENVSGNLVRMAITDTDTQNTVVCGSNAGDGNVVNEADGSEVPEEVHAFSEFLVSSESEPTELFRVDRGSSKTINIKVWLQDDKAVTAYAGKTVTISDVNIVTQNKKGNKVYFVDRTVNDTVKNWTKDVTFQQGNGTSVTMKYNAKSHTYYCDYTPAADNTEVKFTSGSVTWTTDMKSLNSGDSMYYTAYGNHNSSNAGYGTWGEVIEISVSSKTADVLPDTGNVSSVYMVPDKNDSYSKVRMPFTADKKNWVGYIAKEKADNMTFSFTNNGNTYKIPAPNRGNSTLFVVTSATTGYWDPPATITVTAGKKDAGDPKVSYDVLTSTTISVTPGTKVKLIANPKKGFVLKNWVNSDTSAVADGIDSNGYFTPTASGNYNFTAVYVESLTFEAYVRTYDGANLSESTNGGSVEIKCGNQNSTVDSNDGTHFTLNAVKGSTVTYYAKAKDGYVFDGWYTDEACESISESSSDKYELANVEVSKKLYAKFKVDTYTVEAYTQHGNNAPFDKAGKVSFDNNKYASKVTTTVNRNGEVTFYAKPESGYAFIGWYATKDAADPKVTVENCAFDKDNGVYSTKMKIQYSDVKTYALYARFKALYTVDAKAMYNNENVVTGGTVKVGNGESGKYSKDTVMEGENVTVEAIAKKDYKFAGWYTDEICSKPYFKENNNVSPITLNKVSEGITLYAKFESDLTTIYYYNPNDNWTDVYAYMWGDGENNNNKGSDTTFGKPMTHLGGKVWEYSYSSSESWKNVIFSNGNTGNQTGDIPLDQGQKYYKNGWKPSSDIKHTVTVLNVENADITVTADSDTIAEGASRVVYDGTSLTLNAENIASGYLFKNFIVTPSSGTASTLTTNPSNYTIDGSDITVSATFSSSSTVKTFYFENTLNWSNFKIYYSDNSVSWPGQALTTTVGSHNGHNIYSVDLDTSKNSFVVLNNGGSGENQTVDIDLSQFGSNNACWISNESNSNNDQRKKVGGYYTFTP